MAINIEKSLGSLAVAAAAAAAVTMRRQTQQRLTAKAEIWVPPLLAFLYPLHSAAHAVTPQTTLEPRDEHKMVCAERFIFCHPLLLVLVRVRVQNMSKC